MAANSADWIAVDWGTTHLRVWFLTEDGTVLSQASSDAGMGGLARSEYEPALLNLIGTPSRPITAVICGMAGSRQGWMEAPYASAPCKPVGADGAVRVETTDPNLNVVILPGIKQTKPSADVMRGEETQIAGFNALNPDFDGVICLPGTHTKWVHLSAGEVVSFQTFMTGELFALLSKNSVLSHVVAADGWEKAAFSKALDDAMTRPTSIAGQLFSLRAEALVADLSPAAARSRLSGLLIGIELAAARPYWLGQAVALLGDHVVASVYQAALETQGVSPLIADAERLTLEGLKSAYANLKAPAQ